MNTQIRMLLAFSSGIGQTQERLAVAALATGHLRVTIDDEHAPWLFNWTVSKLKCKMADKTVEHYIFSTYHQKMKKYFLLEIN